MLEQLQFGNTSPPFPAPAKNPEHAQGCARSGLGVGEQSGFSVMLEVAGGLGEGGIGGGDTDFGIETIGGDWGMKDLEGDADLRIETIGSDWGVLGVGGGRWGGAVCRLM